MSLMNYSHVSKSTVDGRYLMLYVQCMWKFWLTKTLWTCIPFLHPILQSVNRMKTNREQFLSSLIFPATFLRLSVGKHRRHTRIRQYMNAWAIADNPNQTPQGAPNFHPIKNISAVSLSLSHIRQIQELISIFWILSETKQFSFVLIWGSLNV